MHAAPNPVTTGHRPGRTKYSKVLRRLVGSTILLSGTLIFAADIAWSAAGPIGHVNAKPQPAIGTK